MPIRVYTQHSSTKKCISMHIPYPSTPLSTHLRHRLSNSSSNRSKSHQFSISPDFTTPYLVTTESTNSNPRLQTFSLPISLLLLSSKYTSFARLVVHSVTFFNRQEIFIIKYEERIARGMGEGNEAFLYVWRLFSWIRLACIGLN